MKKEQDYEQLCEVGDILYRVCKNQISTIKIVDIVHYPHCVYRADNGNSYFNRAFGKTLFKTQEEASKSVHRSQYISEKRDLMRKYERELNKKFGLEDHFIIK